jgi:hypothetical protein
MCFLRGGEQHCWLFLVSMKAIGLQASVTFNKAMGGGNDGEWIRGASSERRGYVYSARSTKIGATPVVPPFSHHSSRQPCEQGNLAENAYCGANAYFSSKIKRGPAKLGEDYGSVQKH